MLRLWIVWLTMTAFVGLLLGWSLPDRDSASSASTVFLPGKTTHGHHQVEVKCGVCHEPAGEVREQACLDCHEADLKAARDTHPRTKFIDPTKAVLLERIDATSCLTCHTEHVDERTHDAGLTLPRDYCVHCHDTVADDRPSHANLGFETCTNAGCHNFHDNRALNENFLKQHLGEPAILDSPLRLLADVAQRESVEAPLGAGDQDAPDEAATDSAITEWADSAHATAGVNCSDCHVPRVDDSPRVWTNQVDHESCRRCHTAEVEGFLGGLHGMRLDVGLPPLKPGMARLPMHRDALHRELNCNACHRAHRDDTRFAAVQACLGCHDDDHSRAYVDSGHHDLWRRELAGEAAVGTGVSCATCHMPRVRTNDGHRVQHDQSANLEPNEKMARDSCIHCHGLGFALNALADRGLVEHCYSKPPTVHVESLEMTRRWFESRKRRKPKR